MCIIQMSNQFLISVKNNAIKNTTSIHVIYFQYVYSMFRLNLYLVILSMKMVVLLWNFAMPKEIL